MARLWMRQADGRFAAEPLRAPGWAGAGLGIRRTDAFAREAWLVIGERAVLVNGEPLLLGVRMLTHRDEVRAADGTALVFADDEPAARTAFGTGQGSVRCARCTGDLAVGDSVVRCPACRSWFHETAEFPCWTSIPFCQVCGRRTDHEADAVWQPEEA